MKPPDDPEVAEWLSLAADDLAVAEVVLGSGRDLFGPVCFHCQQAAEKLMKGFLVANHITPPNTHDLQVLRLLASPHLDSLADAARSLSDYAVMPRYPLWIGARHRAAADEALELATAVRDCVMELLVYDS